MWDLRVPDPPAELASCVEAIPGRRTGDDDQHGNADAIRNLGGILALRHHRLEVPVALEKVLLLPEQGD